MTSYWAPHALLPTGPARDVTFEIDAGRFTGVIPNTDPRSASRLAGIALPGFANAHSHAFHRVLRGRTHGSGGTFWTWREQMYAIANRLDPDTYLALARATYAEMALAGVTTVGEFHYLHHAPDGRSYNDPNAMGKALQQAAAEAGIRLLLLDTCYLAGGLDAAGPRPLARSQRRFGDGDADRWAARVSALTSAEGSRVGVAAHSVRAVPRHALDVIRDFDPAVPLHFHVSEQRAENEACLAAYGVTPTQLLDAHGVLDERATAVHATHLTDLDVAILGASGATACLCPTTERDLADGIGNARGLRDAGASLSLGSDQHAVIDLFEEARALEMDERIKSGQRGRFTPAQLLTALTAHASLGWPDAGRLEAGARADLVDVALDSPRTSGAAPDQITFAASACDIRTVIVDGAIIVADGHHMLGDIGRLLATAIHAATEGS